MDQPLDGTGADIAPPARRSVPGAVWVLLVLAIAVGALLFSRARETGSGPVAPERAETATSGATSLPTAVPATPPAVAVPVVPTPPPATAAPAATPTRIPATPSPTRSPIPSATATAVPPTPAPTPRPNPTRAAAPPPTAPAGAGPGRTRADWLALAERDRLRSQQRALFTIQLELVCELPSLAEAWRFDRRGQMWLAPAEHHGRSCFRVFWGRYPDLDSARRAKSTVPRFFFTPTNNPAVVSTRAALLP